MGTLLEPKQAQGYRRLPASILVRHLKYNVIHLKAILNDRIHSIRRLSANDQYIIKNEAAKSLGKVARKLGTLGTSGKIKEQKAIRILTNMLHSSAKNKRKMAIRGLMAMGGKSAALALVARLNIESDQFIKWMLVRRLGKIGSSLSSGQVKVKLIKSIAKILRRNTGYIRRAAIEALGIIRDKSVTNLLLRQLIQTTSIPNISVQIIIALGRIKDNRAVNYLIIMLEKSRHAVVRIAAARSLAKIGGRVAINALKRRLYLGHPGNKERDMTVRRAIISALAKYTGRR